MYYTVQKVKDMQEVKEDVPGVFDQYLLKKRIKHLFIYSCCPGINRYIERSNGTLQEEFLDYHLYLLSENIEEFNSELIDYLILVRY